MKLETLDEKTRRYRDETLLEIESLEQQLASLRIVVKALNSVLEFSSEQTNPPLKAEGRASSLIADTIKAVCTTWKTIREISDSAEDLRSLSQSNLCTQCRWMWEHGLLERRERPFRPPRKHPKRYEYKTPDHGKNPAAVSMGQLGGRKGGPARAASLTPERRSEISSKAANARWKGSKDPPPRPSIYLDPNTYQYGKDSET